MYIATVRANCLQPERPSTFMKRLQSIAKTNWRTDPSVQDVIIAQFFKCLPPNVVSMINLTDKLDDLDNIARLADVLLSKLLLVIHKLGLMILTILKML